MMKLRLLKTLVVATVAMALSPTGVWALGGSGTSSSPYTISTAADMTEFANIVNGSNGKTRNVAACAKLTANIALSGTWTPMGTSSNPYTGTFDGNGKSITGLSIAATSANAGLFGCTNGATVKSLTLAGSISSNSDNVGSAVGYAKGATTISNVISSVNITMSANKTHLGGIVGNIESSTRVLDCVYSGTLDVAASTDSNGGIVGFANANCSGEIAFCFFNGTVKSTGSGPVIGGILGYTNDESKNFKGVHDCYSCGTITYSGSDAYANAIVGRIRARSATTINNTYLSGTAARAANEDCTEKVSTTLNKAITISVTSNNTKYGTVSWEYVNPTATQPVQLRAKATPKTHYHFDHWTGTSQETTPVTVGLTDNVALKAYFVIDKCTLTAKSNNDNYGTVSGGGTYDYGSSATITAEPKGGYTFSKWNDGSTSASRTVTLTADATYTATFVPLKYVVTVNTANADYGTVTGSGTYDYNSSVTLKATPKTGYHFVKWNDGDTNATRTITVPNNNITYVATFEINTYRITYNCEGPGNVSCVSSTGKYTHGSVITLTATPLGENHFVSWDDGSTDNPRTETITSDMTFKACFEINSYTITFAKEGEGSISYDSATDGTPDGSDEVVTFKYNTNVYIHATPAEHYHFDHWSNGFVSSNSIYHVTKDETLTAYFELDKYEVYTYKYGEGKILMSETSPIAYGTTVTLTAVPAEDYHFEKWNDGCTDNPREVVITGKGNYGTIFKKDTWAITAQANDDSFGSVTGTGNCEKGSDWVITAAPATGYKFVSWDDGNTLSWRTIRPMSDETYTAIFEPLNYTLTTAASPSTGGTVKGGGKYAFNSVVTLTAIPAEHYTFSHWSDDSTDNPYDYTMKENNSVTAIFEPDQYTITVSSADPACGTVERTGKSGYGELAFLSAHPAEGYILDYWSDGNTEDTRSITVYGDAEYVAYFIPKVDAMAYFADGTLTFYADGAEHDGTPFVVDMDGDATWGDIRSEITSVVFDPSFAAARPSRLNSWFAYCSHLTSITGLEYLNTSHVYTMNYMFNSCSSLTALDLSCLNTSRVQDMQSMFDSCRSLKTLNLSGFNTSQVTDMGYMFRGCVALTTLDLSSFDTSGVRYLSSMFSTCSSLTALDLSGFNTSEVRFIANMFYGCSSLTELDLSSFVTSNVLYSDHLFYGCSSLNTLIIGNFDMSSAEYTFNMFDGCDNLTNLVLKAVPYLKSGTFTDHFDERTTNVRFELDDNSYIHVGDMSYLPNADKASYTPSTVFLGNKYSFMVPFDITAEQARKMGRFYVYDNYYEGGDVYFRQVTGDLKRHKAYIFEPAPSVTTISVDNVVVHTPYNLEGPDDFTQNGIHGLYYFHEAKANEELNYFIPDGDDHITNQVSENQLFRSFVTLLNAEDTSVKCVFLPVAYPGDLNNDGTFSVGDLAKLIAILNGKATDTNGTADVNGDGEVNDADVQALEDLLLDW